MCLFRFKWLKQGQSGAPSQAGAPRRKTFWKSPEGSSLDLSTSYTTSQSISKEWKGESKGSLTSTGSGISLASLKGLMSDGAQVFTYRDLIKATDNFSPARKLGGGTFRGTIAERDVTVVVENRASTEVDFVAEMKSICNLHHSSLARLIGGCMSGDQVYLVYEYINGANLRQCLRSVIVPGFTALKSWTVRLRVALDIAKGLEYLHEHASPSFVHKYIKSSSIILDNELHVKMTNVGVARIRGETVPDSGAFLYPASGKETNTVNANSSFREQQQQQQQQGVYLGRSIGRSRSIKITGTHGYMAPEYTLTGVVTPKLDVYAFGVVFLEILSGQEAVKMQPGPGGMEMKKTVLPDVLGAILSDSEPRARVRSWIDPLLRDSFPLDCAYKAALVAKKCVEPNPDNRPSMGNVALRLEQLYMASKQWEDSMLASKDLITSTLTAR